MNRKQILFIFAIVVLVCLTRGISVGGNVDVNGDGVVNTADLEFVDKHHRHRPANMRRMLTTTMS